MDLSSANPSEISRASRGRRIFLAVLLVAYAAYGLVLLPFVGGYAGGADSSGYLNFSRLIASGHLEVPRPELTGLPASEMPAQTYLPLGFAPASNGQMVPTYPVGLALFIAGTSKLVGHVAAPRLVLWLHAMAGILLLYFFARRLNLSPVAAAIGALLLAISPIYPFFAVTVMSDIPAMFWCMAALYFAWRGRTQTQLIWLASFSTIVAVLLRPTNVLVLAPITVCLGWSWRRWVIFAVGGLPGAVSLAWLNHRLYGSALSTGYGNIGSSFSPDFFIQAISNYAKSLPKLLTPGLLLVFFAPFTKLPQRERLLALLSVWAISFIGFYAFYFHTHEVWWYLRFILPAFPALILAMLCGATALASRWSQGVRRTGAALAAAAMVGWSFYWTDDLVAMRPGEIAGEKAYYDAARWARASLPPNAVIFGMQITGAFRYYTDFLTVRWDEGRPDLIEKISQAATQDGRPIYAVLFPFETDAALTKKIPGKWTEVTRIRDLEFWRFDGLSPASLTRSPERYFSSAPLGSSEVVLDTVGDWYGPEVSSQHLWNWSHGASSLQLQVAPATTQSARLTLGLRGIATGNLTVKEGDRVVWTGKFQSSREPVSIAFTFIEGHARLDFSTDTSPVPENDLAGARPVTFSISDPVVTLSSATP